MMTLLDYRTERRMATMTYEELVRLVGSENAYLYSVLERLGQATPKQLAAEAKRYYRTVLNAIPVLRAAGLIEVDKDTSVPYRPPQLLRPKRPAA